jgi:hypothetical protein
MPWGETANFPELINSSSDACDCIWQAAAALRNMQFARAVSAARENYFSNRKQAGIGGKAPFANSEFHRHSASKASSSSAARSELTD